MLRRTVLAAALSTALSTAAAQPAMHLSTTGTGQVLIYPYFTTHGGLTTVFTIANTTADVKAIRVRLLEGVNSRPVQQLNLYLSPFATFSAAVAAGGDDGQPARLLTGDPSCTVPPVPAAGFAFTTTAFTGPNQDWDSAGTPPERAALLGSPLRTRDGHIEVIEMGVVRANTALANAATVSRSSGRPLNCSILQATWSPGGIWTSNPSSSIDMPGGGLRGEAALVEATTGLIYGYSATGIEQFYTDASAPAALHSAPTSAAPDLRSARSTPDEVRVALPRDPANNARIETFQTSVPSPDPVTLLLMASGVTSEFSLDPALGSETEWVFTMPTRRWYVQGTSATRPFTNAFTPDGRSCVLTEPMAIFRNGIPARRQGDQNISLVIGPLRSRSFLCASTSAVAARNVARGAPLRLLRAREGLTGFLLGDFPGWTPSGGFGNSIDPPGVNSTPAPLPPSLYGDFDELTGSGVLSLSLWSWNSPFLAPSGRPYYGLPLIGLSFTRYINANAQPGVLANYSLATPVTVEQRDRAPARPPPVTF